MTNQRTPIRFAVIDDYELVVKGVTAMVAPYESWVSICDLDRNPSTARPIDIDLYDITGGTRPDPGGLAGLLANPDVARVVVYTWEMDAKLIQEAARAGVAGYLSKSLGGHDLVDALVRVHRGDRVLTRGADRAAVQNRRWPERAGCLTAREAEVVGLITDGLSNDEIAAQCHLSINSVKSYIRSAYRKMSVARRSQAVLWGIEHGFQPEGRRFAMSPHRLSA